MSLIEIEKKLEEIIANSNAIEEDYKQKIESARTASDEAGEKALLAFNDCNDKDYQKYTQQKRNADDLIEMYSRKLEEFRKSPLLSTDEYEEIAREIETELDHINLKAVKKYVEFFDEMKEAEEEVTDGIVLGNQLLKKLQRNIYKDDCCITASNGNRVFLPGNERKYTNYMISNLNSHIFGNGSYMDKTPYYRYKEFIEKVEAGEN